MIQVLNEVARSASRVVARLKESQSHPPIVRTGDIRGVSTNTDLPGRHESFM